MGLGYIRKVPELESQPVGEWVTQWAALLYASRLRICLSTYSYFPQRRAMTRKYNMTWKCKSNNPFLSLVSFGHVVYHSHRKQTRAQSNDRVGVVTQGPGNKGCSWNRVEQGWMIWVAGVFLYERASWVPCVSGVDKEGPENIRGGPQWSPMGRLRYLCEASNRGWLRQSNTASQVKRASLTLGWGEEFTRK